MYRYLLFFYYDYYPCGDMEDCVLKTNNYDDLIPFINKNYYEDWYRGTITYYDTIEDKYFEADMKPCRNDVGGPYEFASWEERE